MGKRTIEITTQQGNQLIKAMSGLKWPEEVGKDKEGGKKFAFYVREGLDKGIRSLWNALRAVSPIMQERGIGWYGSKDAMHETIPTEEAIAQGSSPDPQYQITRPNTVTPVSLSDDNRKTMFWLLFLLFHSDSKLALGLGIQAELWPLLDQLGKNAVAEMEKELGLGNVNELPLKLDDVEAEVTA